MTKVEPIVILSEDGLLKKYCEENKIKYYLLKYRCDGLNITGISIKNILKLISFPILKKYIKWMNDKVIEEINDIVKNEKIDLIHTCNNRIDTGAIVAIRNKIPHVWHIREFGDLDYRVLHVRKDKIAFMNEGNNYFVAISDAVKHHWIKKGLLDNKITTIYNGFSVEKLKSRKIIKRSYKKINAIFVGYIIKTKGQGQVIKALAKLPERIKESFHIDFYGDYSNAYYRYLKFLIKKYHLQKNISFCGFDIKIEEKLDQYNLAFMCSKSEGFGRVTIDYMLHQVPVIASNTGANQELIEDKVNGLLYEYNNIDDLADKIMYAYNNEKLNDISKNAYQSAVEKYDLNKSGQDMYSLYQKILKIN